MYVKLFIQFPRVFGMTPFVSVMPTKKNGTEFGIGRHAFLLSKQGFLYNGG